MDGGPGSGGPRRLVLLNGLPGAGKSALARALVARRPGALNLDVDLVRALIGGDPAAAAEPARALALTMAVTHLRGGGDVVVPQLVARRDQVARFDAAAVAGGGGFVHLVVSAPDDVVRRRIRADAAPHRAGLDGPATARYAAALHEVERELGPAARVVNDGPGVGGVADRVARSLRWS